MSDQPSLDSMERAADAREGARRRDEAISLLNEWRWIQVLRARRALLEHLLEFRSGTLDDVATRMGPRPFGRDGRYMGAGPLQLAHLGIIQAVGHARSTRASRHRSHLVLWGLADADAASRWLASNPDVPDPASPAEREIAP